MLNLKNNQSTGFDFKFQFDWSKLYEFTVQDCLLQFPILNCVSLILVTITSHIFTNIFQREHIYAVTSYVYNEKNIRFLVVSKSQKV